MEVRKKKIAKIRRNKRKKTGRACRFWNFFLCGALIGGVLSKFYLHARLRTKNLIDRVSQFSIAIRATVIREQRPMCN